MPISGVDHEWTTVETVLIRIDNEFALRGSFPVYSQNSVGSNVGFDAAVCVQKYEPWIIEAYNASITSPSLLRIVEKWNGSTSSPSGKIRGPPIENTRYLNTSGKDTPFSIAHENALRELRRTNLEGVPYNPPSIVGSISPP